MGNDQAAVGPGTDRLADRPLDQPHEERLPLDHLLRGAILVAHQRAIDAGQPGYSDPGTGLFVLTAAYLATRGTCCVSGCRHCPYLSS